MPAKSTRATKALARAAKGKRCALGPPEFAAKHTGYVVGGVSPFGQRKRLATYLDSSALEHRTIAVSGGRRGLQLRVSPHDLVAETAAQSVDLTA